MFCSERIEGTGTYYEDVKGPMYSYWYDLWNVFVGVKPWFDANDGM
jgi:hypothetical protein